MQETQETGSIPGLGRFPGGRNDNPLQYSCLGYPMDKGAWWATVHGLARIRHDLVTKLPPYTHTHTHTHTHAHTQLALLLVGTFFFSKLCCVRMHGEIFKTVLYTYHSLAHPPSFTLHCLQIKIHKL